MRGGRQALAPGVCRSRRSRLGPRAMSALQRCRSAGLSNGSREACTHGVHKYLQSHGEGVGLLAHVVDPRLVGVIIDDVDDVVLVVD
jgi:hypothetical protein